MFLFFSLLVVSISLCLVVLVFLVLGVYVSSKVGCFCPSVSLVMSESLIGFCLFVSLVVFPRLLCLIG